jgi:metal-dependent hydrolase (beta-lactamase superfamily II)
MDKIRSLKITTISENLFKTSGRGQLGLSFLIEFKDSKDISRKILFDTSTNKDAFFYNLKILEIDFSDLDGIVICHGHGDHTARA